jgi:hypothetical protein
MKFPRFSHGGFGKLDYKVLNQAFDLLETVGTDPFNSLTNDKEHRETFVARIIGLTTSATQGASQSGTETVTDGVFVKAYLYDWEEVDIGVGDGASPAGSGTGLSTVTTKTNKGSASNTSEFVTDKGYYPAIDFSPMRQYAANTIVLLTKSLVRTGSKYSHMYAITPLATALPFLARLTAKHATISGLYEFQGLSRIVTGNATDKTLAVNLYELNSIRNPSSYSSALSVNSNSWNGSNTWGHGQDSTNVTLLNLPVGNAGTGTIVIMNQGHILESSGGTAYWFYSVNPVTCIG